MTDTKTKPTAKRNSTQGSGFSAEERAAMKERARELKAEANKADGEKELLAKVAEMPPADRKVAEALHKIVKANAPSLSAKTWYGMPAYTKEGKVLCFFQSAAKFGTRYATVGFTDEAKLDEGDLWPTYFAVKEMTAKVEERISALVKRAVGG